VIFSKIDSYIEITFYMCIMFSGKFVFLKSTLNSAFFSV
jgi:hypothetical protein